MDVQFTSSRTSRLTIKAGNKVSADHPTQFALRRERLETLVNRSSKAYADIQRRPNTGQLPRTKFD
jgi:hypothetical protein